MQNEILSVTNLTKYYGSKIAVENISFSLHANEILGLLGPNGAGKTTTINMILGVLEPSAGHIRIENHDVAKDRQLALLSTNFAAVYSPLPGNLTVRENLNVFGKIYGVKQLDSRITELLKKFHLERFKETRVGTLSSGEQTRVSLAKALLNRPHLLLLDEPTASLDPNIAHEIRYIIKEFAKKNNTAVLWTSHNMYEVEEICDRVLFLDQTKILLEGNPKTLPKEHGQKNLEDLFIVLAQRGQS
ncbi:MAG: ABC transporter ATP-binding protein [Bacteriovorax sp.]|nr:ABC transporter ATP-binding protein [Bacteriovorax sp.]